MMVYLNQMVFRNLVDVCELGGITETQESHPDWALGVGLRVPDETNGIIKDL